jgi:hypothetical protein
LGAGGGAIDIEVGVVQVATTKIRTQIVSREPATGGGYARGKLRIFDLGLFAGKRGWVRVMAMLIIEYRLPTDAVPGYEEWKKVFDTDPVDRGGHGATRHWIYRDEVDPNHFMLSIEFPTVDDAREFLNEPMLKQSWEISGARDSWVLREAEAVNY